ncbi:MAG: hypothetical protein AB1571_00965 [Nanoarchaeota archaeon]
MKEWDELSEEVSKITPDREKARAILQIIALREININSMGPELTTLIVESYYEIIKELITAIMSVDGWKTLSHELLVGYLTKFYKEFSHSEIYTIDQLRKTRNDIAYRGVIIKQDYLIRNKNSILRIIDKLKSILQRKLR